MAMAIANSCLSLPTVLRYHVTRCRGIQLPNSGVTIRCLHYRSRKKLDVRVAATSNLPFVRVSKLTVEELQEACKSLDLGEDVIGGFGYTIDIALLNKADTHTSMQTLLLSCVPDMLI